MHVLLEWLAEAEQALRFHGVLPDDEEALRTLIDQHRVSKIMETMLEFKTRLSNVRNKIKLFMTYLYLAMKISFLSHKLRIMEQRLHADGCHQLI